MTDPLESLRQQPLPEIPRATTGRIREEAHLCLRAPRRAAWRAVATAAVVAFCLSHLGWTVAFLSRIYGP